jgi:aerobic-type carbon monoxide dehydrogenase small subunit (CoxS/CutS family)
MSVETPAAGGTFTGSDEPTVVVRSEVNGSAITAEVPARLNAADFLRHVVGLTGTHVGCEQGVCGMCTVLVDGVAVKSCLMLAAQLDKHTVHTVESLAGAGALTPLQERFREEHALQCGFCTPAFLMTATALCAQARLVGRDLDRDEIREELSGVICRCTGFDGIVTAVHRHLHDQMERLPQ